MLTVLKTFVLLSLLARGVSSSPVAHIKSRAATNPVHVTLNGNTYINKGLVGFGLIPSDFRDSVGDTLGGIGSGIDIKRGTWAQNAFGSYTGTFVVTPDRGYNVEGTIDYQSRQHEIDFVFAPYYDSSKLSFSDAQDTLVLTYKNTTLRYERNDVKTSGLDPTAIRAAQSGFPADATADPQMPIASTSEPHLTIDAEGLVANDDGSFWVSDEYGPYIYKFSATGHLIQTIQPPAAVLPLDDDGNLFFTSDDDPKTGRGGNHGFEGLTLDRVNKILYAMLQAATIQDGGDERDTSRYTRLLAWNVSDPSTRPLLIGEWVVPLPLSDKDNTQECSEIHFVKPGIFFALSRDGDGHGGDDNNTKYKYFLVSTETFAWPDILRQADLFSIVGATDIHGTKYDDPANPIASDGKLKSDITPATYVSFVDFVEENGLERFGLHNDDPADKTLIDAKWESLTLAPCFDSEFPDDFFLFTAADNDFLTKDGMSLGESYDADINVDSQFLVFRVTLPGAGPYNS